MKQCKNSTPTSTRRTAAPVAVDAAFAELPEIGRRVDRPAKALSGRDFAAESRQMISQIGEQLKAIEQQRARLVNLLSELDVPSS